jgi:hypothetical protein
MDKMTRDEILKMEAGPELDALIAEKVMEWTEWPISGDYVTLHGKTGHTIDTFNPSSDISAAWEVVEKLQDTPTEYFFEICKTPVIWRQSGKPTHWHVELGGQKAYADAAPLAICRAALLAVMEAE